MAADAIWDLYLTPLLTASGELESVVGVATDITDRMQAEQAYRESEARFRALVECTTDHLFWVVVQDGGAFLVEGVNPAMARFHQIEPGRIPGPLGEVLPKGVVGTLRPHLHACLDLGGAHSYHVDWESTTGTLTFQVLLVPVREDSGRISRIIGSSRDVTEARVAADALRQTQKLESLGILAGGIAHDFNNLLTAVLGNLNLAQGVLPETSAARTHLRNMERAVNKAADLTQQMLAYSGKGRFVVQPTDLSHMVREMTHLLQVSITKKAKLHLELSEHLTPMEADAAQLHQVVMNLMTNASDALGEGAGTITLRTDMAYLGEGELARRFRGQALNPGLCVVLEVEDSGCGIPAEVLPQIFDPFFTTKQTGRGLGLSAMLGILRAHQAGIEIESEVGRGSCFRVFFPAMTTATLPMVEERSETTPPPTGRVLLVEDDPVVRESTQAMLEILGYTVRVAVDGVEGVALFEEDPQGLDLVLMDLTMPRMDGREAAQRMLARRSDLPILLCSGYHDPEEEERKPRLGLAGFLKKPYSLKDLRKALQSIR